MGTHGLYVYKWRGRYYASHNWWDSYPSGLGESLLSMIPRDAEGYQKWLEKMRSEYSKIEAKLEVVYTLTRTQAETGQMLPLAAAGVEMLEGVPTYAHPYTTFDTLPIEYVYVIDLDTEFFSINGESHFRLGLLPSALDDAVLQDAQAYFFKVNNRAICNDSITTNIPMATCRINDLSAEYAQMIPVVVQPNRVSALNNKPAFILCHEIFNHFTNSRWGPQYIWEARCSRPPSNFVFREMAFALLSLASCSPNLVRFGARTQLTDASIDASFATWNTVNAGSKPVFASQLLEAFHLAGKHAGSAPLETTYWLQGVLVALHCNLDRYADFKTAIVEIVRLGRQEGRRRFNAIATSITHVVLIRVTESNIWHSRLLTFITSPCPYKYDEDQEDSKLDYESREENLVNEDGTTQRKDDKGETMTGSVKDDDHMNVDDPVDSTWIDQEEEGSAFPAVAHLFEATALGNMRPSSSGAHEIFPNEIYQLVVRHTDAKTRLACLEVSRAFREFASESLDFSNGLSFGRDNRKAELQLQYPETSYSGPLSLNISYEAEQDSLYWHPIIGSEDERCIFIPHFAVSVPGAQPTQGSSQQTEEKTKTLQAYLDPDAIYNERYIYAENRRFDYGRFERFLPSQSIIATSAGVAGLYSRTFFLPLGIFGARDEGGVRPFRNPPTDEIPKRPMNTFTLLAGREDRRYALLWSKQPCEDSDAGWKNAIEQGLRRASVEYRSVICRNWLEGSDANSPYPDFAVVVIIGARFKVFHRARYPRIPPLRDFPQIHSKIQKDSKYSGRFMYMHHLEKDGTFLPWVDAGISYAEPRAAWVETAPMGAGGTDKILNVLDPVHRPAIEKAFNWIAEMASQIGKSHTDKTPL